MKKALLLLIAIICSLSQGNACTSAVISGRATYDGRPLLWKHRDTDFLQNSVKYFKGEKYSFIGKEKAGNCLPGLRCGACDDTVWLWVQQL